MAENWVACSAASTAACWVVCSVETKVAWTAGLMAERSEATSAATLVVGKAGCWADRWDDLRAEHLVVHLVETTVDLMAASKAVRTAG